MPAIRFIETRQTGAGGSVQAHQGSAWTNTASKREASTSRMSCCREDLVQVLTQREIANQEIETYRKQRVRPGRAHRHGKGEGNSRHAGRPGAKSKVGVDIKTNNANARTEEARGEAEFIRQTGTAQGAEVEAVGLARARLRGAGAGVGLKCDGPRERDHGARGRQARSLSRTSSSRADQMAVALSMASPLPRCVISLETVERQSPMVRPPSRKSALPPAHHPRKLARISEHPSCMIGRHGGRIC